MYFNLVLERGKSFEFGVMWCTSEGLVIGESCCQIFFFFNKKARQRV